VPESDSAIAVKKAVMVDLINLLLGARNQYVV
jgi:hypothetical protein